MSQYMQAYASTFPFSGGVLVAKGEAILFEGAYGFEDRESKIKTSLETRFPIASLSKAFTALAVLQLEAAGGLSSTDSAQRYLPSYAQVDEAIRIHHLLSHTSGLPDYQVPRGKQLHEVFVEKMGHKVFCETLLGKAVDTLGNTFLYSNPGYYLLGMIVEQVSGMSFEAYLQEHIFSPFGLHQTTVDDPTVSIPHRAKPYSIELANNFVPAPITDARNFYPQGGLVSTVHDLHRWSVALDGLPSSIITKLYDKHIPVPGHQDTFYGYGWGVEQWQGKMAVGHGGSHWGYRAQLMKVPSGDLLVVVLSNFGFQDCLRVVRGLGEIAMGLSVKMPKRPEKVDLSPAQYEPLLGIYRHGDFRIELQKEGEDFWIKYSGQKMKVYPINERVFAHELIETYFEVKTNAEGKLTLWGCEKERSNG